MSTIDLTQSLGDVVTNHPGGAVVLERFGIDYCCGGSVTFTVACSEAGLDPREVADQVVAADRVAERRADAGYAALGLAELADHIESTHHAYLHGEFPRLIELTAKIAAVHGERHPELAEVARLTVAVRDDLEPHMAREEQILFPAIRAIDAAGSAGGTGVSAPIARMMQEHEATGELLARLREVSGGYEVPADGCATYQAAYQGLEAMERDTHLHIHKENNVLFPRVLAP